MDCLLGWIESHQGLASWVQAIFTIVALWITQRIATNQDRTRRKEIVMAANTYAAELMESLEVFSKFAAENNRDEITRESYVFQEAIILGRSIPIELLSEKRAAAYFKLRGISAEISAMIEEIRYLHQDAPITHFRDKFDTLLVRAKAESLNISER